MYELRIYLQCTLYYFDPMYVGRKLINGPICYKNITINKSDNKSRARTHGIASYFCNIAELIATSECNLVNAFLLRCFNLQLLGHQNTCNDDVLRCFPLE